MLKLRPYYFLVSFLLIFIISLLRYPTLSFHAELWAEQGTNYLYNAIYHSFSENLFTTDSGYLVWLPRILSFIVYQVSPLAYYPHLTHMLGIAFISFCLSFINFSALRSFIENDDLRFILSLFFGLFFVPNYENYTFVNFSYHGFFLCAFLLCMSKDHLKTWAFWSLSLLHALICISKFHYLLMAPFIIFQIYIQSGFSRKRTFLFYLPTITTLLIQVLNVLIIFKSNTFIQNNTDSTQFLKLLEKPFVGIYWWTRAHATFLPFIVNIFLVVLLWRYIIKRYLNKKLSPALLTTLITFNLLGILYATISSLNKTSPAVYWVKLFSFPFARQFFIPFNFVVFTLILVILNSDLLPQKKYRILALYLLLITATTLKKSKDPYADSKQSVSSWTDYQVLLSRNSYCVPVNPITFKEIGHGCQKVKEINQNPDDVIDLANNEISHLQFLLLKTEYSGSASLVIEYKDQTREQAILLTQNSRFYKFYELPETNKIISKIFLQDNASLKNTQIFFYQRELI